MQTYTPLQILIDELNIAIISIFLFRYYGYQDVQYGDIDYMRNQLDFTWDKTAYAELPEFVEELHQRGQRYIIILVRTNLTNYSRQYTN